MRPIDEMENFVKSMDDEYFASQQSTNIQDQYLLPPNHLRGESSSPSSLSATPEYDNGLTENESDFSDFDSSIIYSWTADEERQKLAADFCFAMNDNDAAFHMYSTLYNSVQNRPGTSWLAKNVLLIHCVRAAESPKNAQEANRLLTERLAEAQESEKSFVFGMLEALVQERSGNADAAETRDRIYNLIASIIDNIDENDDGSDKAALFGVSSWFYDFDAIGYQCLCHGLKVYDTLRKHKSLAGNTPGDTFSSEQFLVQHSSPKHAECAYKCIMALRSCIEWCLAQLNSNPTMPAEVVSFEFSGRSKLWSENIQLFCTLWSALYQTISDDQHQLDWYRNSEATLGISSCDLLVTVCWMIGDVALEAGVDGGVLQRAAVGVQGLVQGLSHDPGDVWMHFLNKFTWMNQVVSNPSQDDESFMDLARDHIRRYVSSRLDIQLPGPSPGLLPPAHEPVSEPSYLDQLSTDGETFETQLWDAVYE